MTIKPAITNFVYHDNKEQIRMSTIYVSLLFN